MRRVLLTLSCAFRKATQHIQPAGRGGMDKNIGAVAQLGERYTGSVEVRGSIPLGSTNKINQLIKTRCDDEVLVTRWSHILALLYRFSKQGQ